MTAAPLDPSHADTGTTKKRRGAWMRPAIVIAFALFFAYDLWEAVGNLIELPAAYAAANLASETPWGLLVANLALVPVVFVIALLAGRRRNLGQLALLLLLGLCIVAVASLDAIAFLPFV